MASTAELKVILQGQDNLSKVFSSATKSAQHFGNTITGGVGKSLAVVGGVAAGAAKIGIAAVGVASVAAGAGLFGAIKAAASFEEKMSAIKAVSGATGDEMNQARILALKLGKDTAFSANEAADGIGELLKGGVAIKDIFGGGAKAALDLAAAGGVSVADAAALMANAAAAFGLTGDKLAHVGDVVAGFANATTGSVSDFKFALQQAGGVAASLGFTLDDTALGIAALGKVGVLGSDAGTKLKQFFLNLIPQSKEAGDVMKDLGIVSIDTAKTTAFLAKNGIKPASQSASDLFTATAQLVAKMTGQKKITAAVIKDTNALLKKQGLMSNAFFDGEGNVKSFTDVIGILGDATKNLTDEQRVGVFRKIFGTDAGTAANIFASQGKKGVEAIQASINAVKATDVAEERLNNFAGAIKTLQGSWETLQITVGTAFLPILTKLVKGLDGVIGRFIETGQASRFAEIAADALLTFIGALTGEWGPAAAGQINPIVQAIGNLGVFIRTVAVPAISALVGWIAGPGIAAFQTFAGIFQAEVLPRLMEFGTFVQTTVLPALMTFGQWLMGEGLSAANAFGQWFQTDGVPLLQSFQGIAATVGGILKDILGPAMMTVAANGSTILKEVGPLVDAFNGLLTALRPLGQLLGAAFGAIASSLPGLITQLTGFINSMTGMVELVKTLVVGLSAAFQALGRGDAGALAIIQATMEGIAISTAKVAEGQKQVAAGAAQATAGQAAFAQGIGLGPQLPTTARPPMMAGPPMPTQEEIERINAHREAMAAFVAQAQAASAALGGVTAASTRLAPSMKSAAAQLVGPY